MATDHDNIMAALPPVSGIQTPAAADISNPADNVYDCLSASYREEIYRRRTPIINEPRRVKPADHTMKDFNFFEYIGRTDEQGAKLTQRKIDCKKFSTTQQKYIADAHEKGLNINVFGALRTDADIIADILNYDVMKETVDSHSRSDKPFNIYRQMMCFARSRTDTNRIELWCFVFPSPQYVDQIAELIQAIIDDFNVSVTKSPTIVKTYHFTDFEKTIRQWTGFDDSIRRFVRTGDVVAIGNVELFIPGLEDYGFKSTTSDWRYFGLNKMFGSKCFVHNNSSRIVVIGFKESFWGQASAEYVSGMMSAGARHVLYGSKAATTVPGTTQRVFSPTNFYNIVDMPSGPNSIAYAGTHYSELDLILKSFDIEHGQGAVTVPTVIGETNDQRTIYTNKAPACLDCENGHIAASITSFNRRLKELKIYDESFVSYVPVHFLTDYIYLPTEKIKKGQVGLGAKDKALKLAIDRQKFARFRKIGQFFGLYALKNGIQELSVYWQKDGRRPQSVSNFDAAIGAIKPLLDGGLDRDALDYLTSIHQTGPLPSSDLLAALYVAQRSGFAEFFESAYSELTDAKDRLSPSDLYRKELFYLKYLSQVGDYCSAITVGERLLSSHSPEVAASVGQYGALERRLAVSYSAVEDEKLSLTFLEKAQNLVPPHSSKYYTATNGLFSHICKLHLLSEERSVKIDQIIGDLSKIRSEYTSLLTESSLQQQISIEKCALATVFLEAAFLMACGSHYEEAALRRLYAAHILNNRLGGNEISETYGEIVSAVDRPEARAIIGSAMRRDPDGRREFADTLRAWRQTWFRPSETAGAVLQLLRCSAEEREAAIMRIIGDEL